MVIRYLLSRRWQVIFITYARPIAYKVRAKPKCLIEPRNRLKNHTFLSGYSAKSINYLKSNYVSMVTLAQKGLIWHLEELPVPYPYSHTIPNNSQHLINTSRWVWVPWSTDITSLIRRIPMGFIRSIFKNKNNRSQRMETQVEHALNIIQPRSSLPPSLPPRQGDAPPGGRAGTKVLKMKLPPVWW